MKIFLHFVAYGIAALVALIVATWFYAKYGVQPLSDAEIRQRFESHKSSFYSLRDMLIEDHNVLVEAKNSFSLHEKQPIQEKRYNEYQKLLADIGAVRAESAWGWKTVKITMWSNFPWAFISDQGEEKYLIATVPESKSPNTKSRPRLSTDDSYESYGVQVHVAPGWTIDHRKQETAHWFGF